MTPVKILRNFPISPDGIRVETWMAGSEHTVNDATLELLIGEGACEIIETKAYTAAPENKVQPIMPGKKEKGGMNTTFQVSERPPAPKPSKPRKSGK